MERVDTGSTDSSVQRFLRRYVLGDGNTISGTVYGTIVVLSVLAAGAKTYEHHLWRLAVIVGISVSVLWVAHVYSHGLGESLAVGRRLTVSELLSIARREYSIVLTAALPLLAVVLAIGLTLVAVEAWVAH
jgi:hypothetical protein